MLAIGAGRVGASVLQFVGVAGGFAAMAALLLFE
jgi:hypothetical protein